MDRAPGDRVLERDLWLRVDCVLRRLCEDEWCRFEWVDLRLMTEAASSKRPISSFFFGEEGLEGMD